ncbi:fructoselysine 6-kinase [Lactobacillus halodurans]|uniref:Fructoselysine 6-kinase n=1 Tax=Companilactobacillus halodurans TaxID=2584183 RepID=A0A5P0ZP85_9LACO|nr:PfkB family carbohydrate kinase [Companilactobacillus halodurans]MQS76012.1 fructoselysine 6-kinase [Companilactobacillus halodurans]
MRVIGVGDNVVDMYLDQKKMYLGGNALNFANFATDFGIESAFVDVFGTDEIAEYAKSVLKKLNVDFSHSKTIIGENGHSRVTLKDNDRVFIDSNRGGVLKNGLDLSPADIKYINRFDVAHFNINGQSDQYLPMITRAQVVYDFSDFSDFEAYKKVAKNIDLACFSVGDLARTTIEEKVQMFQKFEMTDILITRGNLGAIFYHNGHAFEQAAKQVKAIDTMGAGDAFITAFSIGYFSNKDIDSCLEMATDYAAKQVQRAGSFGNARDLPLKYNVI